MTKNNNKTKRLFIGTFIKYNNFANLYPEIQEDFKKIISGKWVEPENMHFTYKFLGAVDENKIPEITSTLDSYLRVYESKLEFRGLGVFPHPKSPRILWLGLYNPDRSVFDAAMGIDEKMAKIGFSPEKRKFLPHVTLVRVKKSLSTGFLDILREYKNIEAEPMDQFSINLIESKLTPEGPIYSIIK